MTKRVIINADGQTVDNVCALSAGSPAGTGTFLDVVDTMKVSPLSVWNKNTGAPAFTDPPAGTFSNILGVQTGQALVSGGFVTLAWASAFPNVPIPVGFEVFDPAGGTFSWTLTANTATNITYKVRKNRTLPSVLTLLTALVSYDTYQDAPDGTICYISAKLATQ